ncbi:hypothetical protein B0H17DRAFT_1032408 [Mycena rosella]|uniref:F-box domain-containing protein n=1 Tax=Mycena rosella TaxID=1033263 RepID=A0AAD7GX89_MYCRO|nr:hypothetical protein B0H17DRAFT_1032408 [Mycena rosella]
MSRIPCTSFCPFHCAVEAATGPLTSPYPDLLSSASSPSDLQVAVIWRAIETAETEVSAVDTHLVHLRSAMEQHTRKRAELQDFVKSHRAMVSAIRRLPSELLSEIFVESVDVSATFEPGRNEPWMIAQVCSRWRAVALTSPRLWSNFVLPADDPYSMRALSLQLERASHAHLFIRFTSRPTLDTLNLFLTASAHWEVVTLALGPAEFTHLFDYGGNFPTLKTLTLRSWEPIQCTDGQGDMRESFPALRNLQLDVCYEAFPRQLLLPWSNLRTCTLQKAHSSDALWLLSQLSPNTEFSVVRCANLDFARSTLQTKSCVRSLTITTCSTLFVRDLLTGLVAPALQELTLERIDDDDDQIQRDQLLSFLDRSACPLTHLRICATTISGDDLIRILEMPPTRGIVHLDVSAAAVWNRGVGALGAQHLVPNLRTLVLQGTPDIKHVPLLALLRSRWPVLRSVRLDGSESPQDVNSSSSLEAGELDVIIRK